MADYAEGLSIYNTTSPATFQDAASLGNYTSIVSVEGPRTLSGRALRYFLQSAARSLAQDERVSDCLRTSLSLPGSVGLPSISVLYSPSVKRAHFGGLMTCGSVWMCPNCAAKIAERRRVELGEAITKHTGCGGMVLLLTYTIRHHQGDRLDVILPALRAAHRKLKQGWAYQEFKKRYGFVGTVTALEPTHSPVNGWHPHIHELMFLEPGADLVAVEKFLRERWSKMVLAVGLDAVNEHGFSLEYSDSAEETLKMYVTKLGQWDLSAEMTRSTTKKARGRAGRTPAAILYDFAVTGDLADGELWQEYAAAFKGKNHLVWSKGLRAKLLPDSAELTDEQLAALHEEPAYSVANLSLAQWRVILKHDLRAALLDVADSGSSSAVWSFLAPYGIQADPLLNLGEVGYSDEPDWCDWVS